MNHNDQSYFTEQLLAWHQLENNRQLPWKSEKDPYKIWLSEIILQQTRAEQGWPYYERFITQYPTVADLANAPEAEVFRLWQGLGYYARCRNLQATANIVTHQFNGQFPNTYAEILALKGVGPYTAAAISSFAFNLPFAVVDGNVYRVLSRYFDIETPIDSTEGKKEFGPLAQSLLDETNPAAYNQAIMDFGAVICKPQQPLCDICYLKERCRALKNNTVTLLPVKSKKLTIRKRRFHYFVFVFEDKIWVRKRTDKDVWQDLHEFYLIESETSNIDIQEIMPALSIQKIEVISKEFKQKLTHQSLVSKFYIVELREKFEFAEKQGFWIDKNSLHEIAFPKTIVSFLKENPYF